MVDFCGKVPGSTPMKIHRLDIRDRGRVQLLATTPVEENAIDRHV